MTNYAKIVKDFICIYKIVFGLLFPKTLSKHEVTANQLHTR